MALPGHSEAAPYELAECGAEFKNNRQGGLGHEPGPFAEIGSHPSEKTTDSIAIHFDSVESNHLMCLNENSIFFRNNTSFCRCRFC